MQLGDYESPWDELWPHLMEWLRAPEQRESMAKMSEPFKRPFDIPDDRYPTDDMWPDVIVLQPGEEDMTKGFRVVPVAEEIGGSGEFISIPLEGLTESVAAYVTHIKTGNTADVCKCVWAHHPDDVDVPEGHCRACSGTPDAAEHMDIADIPPVDYTPAKHAFRGRRRRHVQEHPLCPVHTAVGQILGFLHWKLPEDDRLSIPDMVVIEPVQLSTMDQETLTQFLSRKREESTEDDD